MPKSRFSEGFAEALGFLGGSLAGFWIGRWLELDIFAPVYGPTTLVAIFLVSLGGGLGLHVAKAWRAKPKSNR